MEAELRWASTTKLEKTKRKSSKKFKGSPMTIKRTLRKLEIKYHMRAPYPDAPYHQLQRNKILTENEISKRIQKTHNG